MLLRMYDKVKMNYEPSLQRANQTLQTEITALHFKKKKRGKLCLQTCMTCVLWNTKFVIL